MSTAIKKIFFKTTSKHSLSKAVDFGKNTPGCTDTEMTSPQDCTVTREKRTKQQVSQGEV